MFGHGNHKLKISIFHHQSPSNSDSKPDQPEQPKPKLEYPEEYICPISKSLMVDPVVVSSGHTFDRLSIEMCKDLEFLPELDDGSTPDLSSVIANRNLKFTIIKWCDKNGIQHPQQPNPRSIRQTILQLKQETNNRFKEEPSVSELIRGVADKPPGFSNHATTEVGLRIHNNRDDMIVSQSTLLPFKTQPSSYSSSSSSDSNHHSSSSSSDLYSSEDEFRLISKFKSVDVFEQEQGLVSLRRMTKSDVQIRVSLCTKPLLASLLPLISSRSSALQINAVAALVNVSLEKSNKVKIVRAGFVSPLIDVLDRGYSESQEHAAGALFSLSLDDENKMAIGILGALPALMHALRSESERTRHDSALCLYHLTLNPSNRVKLVKLGAVPVLLSLMDSSEDSATRVLLILCNVAVCTEGRSAMLDANAVGCLVGMLKEKKFKSEATRENCVVALYALSEGGLRFKGLAKVAGAVEVLREVEERGTERAREKAKRILQMMRAGGSGSVEFDGVDLGQRGIDGGGVSWTGRLGTGLNRHGPSTTKF